MRAVILIGVASLLLSGSVALAQQNGDTSGPATGQAVKPSAATQKAGTGDSAGTAAGAPGVEAKPGSEAGAAPEKPKN